MTDVLKTPEKKRIRRALVGAALQVLEKEGYKVGGGKGGLKGRVRQIAKNGRSQLASIRTSQDHWIAFPRNEKDTKWGTLSDVDVVVVAAVDDTAKPKFAQVHIFDAKEVRSRFDRAYAARRKADHQIDLGRGVWVSLYHEEKTEPVYHVGAGIGLVHPPIAKIPLDELAVSNGDGPPVLPTTPENTVGISDVADFAPLTIPQAKVRLARTLGVDPASITITVQW
jgi:hypothetical protein